MVSILLMVVMLIWLSWVQNSVSAGMIDFIY